MTKRILFNIAHLDLLELQEDYQPLLDMDGVRFVLKQLPLPNADGLSLMIDGRLICCFGYLQILPGVAEVWLLPSIHMDKYPLALVREVKGYLDSTAEVRQWHRIQTLTRNLESHCKWIKVLGFEKEGCMKNYYKQEDYILSARYFEWGAA